MASPDSLRLAITAIHQAIQDHDDPQAKATLATCLQNMLKVQATDHAPPAGAPQDAMMSRVAGPGGPPPGY